MEQADHTASSNEVKEIGRNRVQRQDRSEEPPAEPDEVLEGVMEELYTRAVNWSNPRTRAYLETR